MFFPGGVPGSLEAVDLDLDGFADLVTGDSIFSEPGTGLSIHFNDRRGRLEVPTSLAIPESVPGTLVHADFDRDGDPDLAMASRADHRCEAFDRVVIIENLGGRELAPALSVEAGRGTLDLQAADLDRDGDVDLLTVDAGPPDGPGGGITVLRNRGDGSFDPPEHGRSAAGPSYSLAATDFDGDGDIDLAATHVGLGFVTLFINEGGGTFLAAGRITTGSDPVVLATGDLDGDEVDDLVTGNREELGAANVSVFRSRGDGVFFTGRNYTAGTRARWISLGDIDADGDLDAASGGVHILVNDGTGVLESRRVHDTEVLSGVLADLDGDGDLDVAAGDRTLLLNDGKGAFDARGRPSQATGERLLGADLDGDRDIDLIEGGVSVAWNLGGASFEAPWKTAVPRHAHLTGVVDRDADGDMDLTAASGPFAGFLDAASDGRFESARWRLLAPGEFILPMMLVDLDRNAGLEMVFITGAFEMEGFWRFALFKLPDGLDPTLREEVLDLGVAVDGAFDLDSADLDGDADLDLVVTEFECGTPACSSTVFILLNDGRGNLSATALPARERPMRRLIPVDLDGDGDLDLAADDVSMYRNLGGAVFESPVLIAPACCGLAAADVDGDGDSDLATGEALLRNAGDGRAFEVISHRSKLGADAALGDLDGNGFPDLVGSSFTGRLDILVNDGNGGLQASAWIPSRTRVEFLEDMDGDGRPDIVARGEEGLVIHWNRVDRPIVRGEHTDLDSDGRIDSCEGAAFTRGDLTGDGRIDITDPIAILLHLFQGAAEPGCIEAADADDDSSIGLTDPIFLLVHLFQGGRPPPHPGPDDPCHHDIDGDFVGCIENPGCRR